MTPLLRPGPVAALGRSRFSPGRGRPLVTARVAAEGGGVPTGAQSVVLLPQPSVASDVCGA
jgi:hypothetical protein